MKELEDNLEEIVDPFRQKESQEIDVPGENPNPHPQGVVSNTSDSGQTSLPPKKAKFMYTETKLESTFDNELKMKIKKEEEERKEKIRLKAEKKHQQKLSVYIYKDYTMFLLLTLSPAFNYNYLYLPYLFIGMLYLFIIGDLSRCKIKLKYLDRKSVV